MKRQQSLRQSIHQNGNNSNNENNPHAYNSNGNKNNINQISNAKRFFIFIAECIQQSKATNNYLVYLGYIMSSLNLCSYSHKLLDQKDAYLPLQPSKSQATRYFLKQPQEIHELYYQLFQILVPYRFLNQYSENTFEMNILLLTIIFLFNVSIVLVFLFGYYKRKKENEKEIWYLCIFISQISTFYNGVLLLPQVEILTSFIFNGCISLRFEICPLMSDSSAQSELTIIRILSGLALFLVLIISLVQQQLTDQTTNIQEKGMQKIFIHSINHTFQIFLKILLPFLYFLSTQEINKSIVEIQDKNNNSSFKNSSYRIDLTINTQTGNYFLTLQSIILAFQLYELYEFHRFITLTDLNKVRLYVGLQFFTFIFISTDIMHNMELLSEKQQILITIILTPMLAVFYLNQRIEKYNVILHQLLTDITFNKELYLDSQLNGEWLFLNRKIAIFLSMEKEIIQSNEMSFGLIGSLCYHNLQCKEISCSCNKSHTSHIYKSNQLSINCDHFHEYIEYLIQLHTQQTNFYKEENIYAFIQYLSYLISRQKFTEVAGKTTYLIREKMRGALKLSFFLDVQVEALLKISKNSMIGDFQSKIQEQKQYESFLQAGKFLKVESMLSEIMGELQYIISEKIALYTVMSAGFNTYEHLIKLSSEYLQSMSRIERKLFKFHEFASYSLSKNLLIFFYLHIHGDFRKAISSDKLRCANYAERPIMNDVLMAFSSKVYTITASIGKNYGSILKYSDGIPEFFGYTKKEFYLIKRIEQLMPNCIGQKHQLLVDHFVQTGESEVVREKRLVVVKKSRELYALANLFLCFNFSYLDDFVFTAFFCLPETKDYDPKKETFLVFDERMRLSGYSENFMSKIGLKKINNRDLQKIELQDVYPQVDIEEMLESEQLEFSNVSFQFPLFNIPSKSDGHTKVSISQGDPTLPSERSVKSYKTLKSMNSTQFKLQEWCSYLCDLKINIYGRQFRSGEALQYFFCTMKEMKEESEKSDNDSSSSDNSIICEQREDIQQINEKFEQNNSEYSFQQKNETGEFNYSNSKGVESSQKLKESQKKQNELSNNQSIKKQFSSQKSNVVKNKSIQYKQSTFSKTQTITEKNKNSIDQQQQNNQIYNTLNDEGSLNPFDFSNNNNNNNNNDSQLKQISQQNENKQSYFINQNCIEEENSLLKLPTFSAIQQEDISGPQKNQKINTTDENSKEYDPLQVNKNVLNIIYNNNSSNSNNNNINNNNNANYNINNNSNFRENNNNNKQNTETKDLLKQTSKAKEIQSQDENSKLKQVTKKMSFSQQGGGDGKNLLIRNQSFNIKKPEERVKQNIVKRKQKRDGDDDHVDYMYNQNNNNNYNSNKNIKNKPIVDNQSPVMTYLFSKQVSEKGQNVPTIPKSNKLELDNNNQAPKNEEIFDLNNQLISNEQLISNQDRGQCITNRSAITTIESEVAINTKEVYPTNEKRKIDTKCNDQNSEIIPLDCSDISEISFLQNLNGITKQEQNNKIKKEQRELEQCDEQEEQTELEDEKQDNMDGQKINETNRKSLAVSKIAGQLSKQLFNTQSFNNSNKLQQDQDNEPTILNVEQKQDLIKQILKMLNFDNNRQSFTEAELMEMDPAQLFQKYNQIYYKNYVKSKKGKDNLSYVESNCTQNQQILLLQKGQTLSNKQDSKYDFKKYQESMGIIDKYVQSSQKSNRLNMIKLLKLVELIIIVVGMIACRLQHNSTYNNFFSSTHIINSFSSFTNSLNFFTALSFLFPQSQAAFNTNQFDYIFNEYMLKMQKYLPDGKIDNIYEEGSILYINPHLNNNNLQNSNLINLRNYIFLNAYYSQNQQKRKEYFDLVYKIQSEQVESVIEDRLKQDSNELEQIQSISILIFSSIVISLFFLFDIGVLLFHQYQKQQRLLSKLITSVPLKLIEVEKYHLYKIKKRIEDSNQNILKQFHLLSFEDEIDRRITQYKLDNLIDIENSHKMHSTNRTNNNNNNNTRTNNNKNRNKFDRGNNWIVIKKKRHLEMETFIMSLITCLLCYSVPNIFIFFVNLSFIKSLPNSLAYFHYISQIQNSLTQLNTFNILFQSDYVINHTKYNSIFDQALNKISDYETTLFKSQTLDNTLFPDSDISNLRDLVSNQNICSSILQQPNIQLYFKDFTPNNILQERCTELFEGVLVQGVKLTLSFLQNRYKIYQYYSSDNMQSLPLDQTNELTFYAYLHMQLCLQTIEDVFSNAISKNEMYNDVYLIIVIILIIIIYTLILFFYFNQLYSHQAVNRSIVLTLPFITIQTEDTLIKKIKQSLLQINLRS